MEQKKIVPKEMEIEIIEESDMEFVPRGRKSNLSDDFVKNIKNSIEKSNAVSMKKFVILKEFTIPSDLTNQKDIKNYKATTSAMLRGLAKRLGYSSEIRWHKETVPAIRFTSLKGKTK